MATLQVAHVVAYVVCKDAPEGPCTLKILDAHNPSRFGSYPLEPVGTPSATDRPFETCNKNDPVWYFNEDRWKPGWVVLGWWREMFGVGTVGDNVNFNVETVDHSVINVEFSHLRRRWPLGIRLITTYMVNEIPQRDDIKS